MAAKSSSFTQKRKELNDKADLPSLEETLSKSKKRKIIKAAVKSKRKEQQNLNDFHQINVLCNAVLAARKSKEAVKKEQLIGEIIAKLRECLEQNLYSASFSRSTQICLKDATAKHREEIWNMLRDKVRDLCLGKYAHKLVIKLYLYGNRDVKQFVTKAIVADSEVFFSKFGSKVWEYVYTRDIPSSKQREMLFRIILPNLLYLKVPNLWEFTSFHGFVDTLDTTTHAALMDHLSKLIQRSIDKELLDKSPIHTLVKYFTLYASEKQLTNCMEGVSEGAIYLVTTKDGVEALSRLLGYATAKQRKLLIKSLKGKVAEMANNQINYILLLRIMTVTDDTKFVTSTIWKEIFNALSKICVDKYGSKVILQVLSPNNHRYLNAYEVGILNLASPMSLKDKETRHSELQTPLIAALQNILVDSRNTRLCLEWLKDAYARQILMEYLKLTKDKEIVDVILDQIAKESSLENGLFDHPIGHRSLLLLLTQSMEYPLLTSSNVSFEYSAWRIMKPIISSILVTRGVFVLLHILKRSSDSEVLVELKNCLSEDTINAAREDILRKGGKCSGLDSLKEAVSQKF